MLSIMNMAQRQRRKKVLKCNSLQDILIKLQDEILDLNNKLKKKNETNRGKDLLDLLGLSKLFFEWSERVLVDGHDVLCVKAWFGAKHTVPPLGAHGRGRRWSYSLKHHYMFPLKLLSTYFFLFTLVSAISHCVIHSFVKPAKKSILILPHSFLLTP